MPFMDLIKKAIFEEEPVTQQPAKPAPSSAAAPQPLDSAAAPAAYVPMGTRDNQFYTRLAKQTDLTAVPELARIEAFAAPLTSVITDKALRYKAALATAQSQGGLTKDAILKGFDNLLNVLNSSASTFTKQTDDVSRTEVGAKLAQITEINDAIQQKQKEISNLQQQVKSLQSQAEVSRSKLQEAKTNFAAALERRRAEIQQQRKEFETILG
jgi:chromosome segregation ATPase